MPWQFSNGPAGAPDRGRYGAVDCSGYVRLVFGYRLGMPLLNTNTAGPGLPRRAFAISEFGPSGTEPKTANSREQRHLGAADAEGWRKRRDAPRSAGRHARVHHCGTAAAHRATVTNASQRIWSRFCA
ncbi:hypothetical protein [Lentzea guizhouensis]|uniref:hypothetical protein n=1 Tax=Lentzea guizhouensis TaxID=1586287 RepID=UPI000A881364|nr:hypothetical protein [Lentzea guizhouensis]